MAMDLKEIEKHIKEALPDALVGGLTAQSMQPLDPISIDDDSDITYKPGQPPKDRGTPVGGDIGTGRERDYGFELPKAQEGMLKLAEGGGLKALPSAEENPGIRKLPEGVRNKMGYMQEGGITNMIEGGAPDTGKNDKEIIKNEIQLLKQKKDEAQPTKIKTSGSTFKNPIDQSEKKVWQLIKESVPLEKSFGDASISEKHCNFFVNKGNAKFEDMKKLINFVSESVFKKTGIKLETEIKILE